MSDLIVIDIKEDGVVEGLHFDEFDLKFLGRKKVRRASEIFHDEATDRWDVLLPGQIVPYPGARGFGSYNEARDFEVVWLQTCRIMRVEGLSAQGETICRSLRSDWKATEAAHGAAGQDL